VSYDIQTKVESIAMRATCLGFYEEVLAVNGSKPDKPLSVLKNYAKPAGYRDKPYVRGHGRWGSRASLPNNHRV
jgi:hypothetical protein